MPRGQILYKNGDQYCGQLQNSKMQGQGLYKFKNGSFYQGQFHDNQFQGRGKLVDKLNDLTIVGQFSNGQACGYARVLYADGSQYQGGLKYGLRHGKGVYKYANNEAVQQYQGLFQDDSYQGYGQMIFRDKRKYKGDFKNNLFQGQGELSTSQFVYIGQFHKGRMQGNGTIKYSTNEYYTGDFQLNKRHGIGKYHYSNGTQYNGQWKQDKRHGKGKLKKSNGDQIQCEFQNDQPVGEIVSKQGKYDIVAQIDKGRLNGPTTITSPGLHMQVSYKNGAKNGIMLMHKENNLGEKITYRGQFKQGNQVPYMISYSNRF